MVTKREEQEQEVVRTPPVLSSMRDLREKRVR